ncbi:hypothetical protein Q0N40_10435 [Corynebacterium pseudokroppenstedtii]|uniref:Uncharacterized protein n=1 Tax=Corynebacterium pseudokroppenstedtii TaxID=2804917 RepID=A0AAU0PZD8_9CORY|nr:hypothetical protein [Corynebacterium pseudokroppenstedtii]QRP14328.1 hypothetical protein I6J24_09745 [Corynebacterium kroppenstedtii]MBY0790473.1 hypothetical protein [Corynebacterium pseudokroppenstedtii]MCF6792986.1 hypothetical protein [Corynebacterium pseudokroppenstedtii]MCF8702219.1 hypothetical protein [Corynebacterium pseudokroppenstedtii]MCG2635638.1 hypothetical protein [Corynebacterium pseudokroppenstedtii]
MSAPPFVVLTPSPHVAIGPTLNGDEIGVMLVVHPAEQVSIFRYMEARAKIKRIVKKGGD